jgi:hypothetical protein
MHIDPKAIETIDPAVALASLLGSPLVEQKAATDFVVRDLRDDQDAPVRPSLD